MAASAMKTEDSDLASQCMAFCQALATKGQTFNFNLNIGSSFSFSLDTRAHGTLSLVKKKMSPSTVRRNARRRKEFLDKKLVTSCEIQSSPTQTISEEESGNVNNHVTKEIKCDACDDTFNMETDFEAHMKGKHSTSPPGTAAKVPSCEGAEVSPPKRSYLHATVAKEPSQIQFGPRNGLRPNWGRWTKKA